ncbi:MAG: valine--tRNA ligase [Terracidiphilus sp.]|jgi:valyl-tRNA synthetase
MPHDLPKAYDPTAIEDQWAGYWVRENLFAVPTPGSSTPPVQNQCLDGQSFAILLPPPNVTGNLHMGHMFEHTESDILARWRRMRGDRVLWVPGTDHAGIATQMLVERQLAEEGTSRQKMGREAFLKRVWQWKEHYGNAILEQMKRIGDTVDWQREYFTMSESLSVAVREAFVRLYHQDLIYRGAYIVNWCPRCQTAISDLEVVHSEQKGHLWEIKYPVLGDGGKETGEFITVATTRPETMLGDTAVAIHPEDERYLHLHGKKLQLPLMDREIPIVVDPWVSREFGTGAVKVTPAHDPNDFAIGERHHLPSINVMDDSAHINENGGPYQGLDRHVARKKIVQDLEERQLLAGIKDHVNSVGHCDRCKTVVEPRLSMQWFIAVNKEPNGGGESMAEKARAAVRSDANGNKAIRFTPENYEKIYLEWMTNIHDWCISRQLWWGHRIPAWHCAVCHKITVPEPGAAGDPAACVHCGSDKMTQETDVLDTWFSSGLLPVSVFGWPNFASKTPGAPGPSHLGTGEGIEDRADFDAFYPTSLLVTGFDILFFWVARMIMMGCWFSKDVPMPDGSPRPLAESVPFKEVYIHALVRDANREKMSKTKGNVVNPIEIVKQYGTDAVRFTLASMASPGTDIAFNVARTEGYRAFANKIWNAARFIFMNVDRAAEVGATVDPSVLGQMPTVTADAPLEARWIVAELHATAAKVNESLENYRFDEAASTVYQFFWGSFCDWYIEIVKLRLDFEGNQVVNGTEGQILRDLEGTRAALATLVSVFEAALRLLSPFMPFVTEELWHAVYDGKPPAKSIALTRFPQAITELVDAGTQSDMGLVQKIVTGIRTRRKEGSVEEKTVTDIEIDVLGTGKKVVAENQVIIQRLARVGNIQQVMKKFSDGLLMYSDPDFDIGIKYERTVDVAAEHERLTRDIANYEKGLAAAERQLGNEAFLAKAPAHVVEGLKKQEAETRLLLEKARVAIDGLSG